VHSANQSLAAFVRDCFTYLERGFVFKLISMYCNHFNPGNVKVSMNNEYFSSVQMEKLHKLQILWACSICCNYRQMAYALWWFLPRKSASSFHHASAWLEILTGHLLVWLWTAIHISMKTLMDLIGSEWSDCSVPPQKYHKRPCYE